MELAQATCAAPQVQAGRAEPSQG